MPVLLLLDRVCGAIGFWAELWLRSPEASWSGGRLALLLHYWGAGGGGGEAYLTKGFFWGGWGGGGSGGGGELLG